MFCPRCQLPLAEAEGTCPRCGVTTTGGTTTQDREEEARTASPARCLWLVTSPRWNAVRTWSLAAPVELGRSAAISIEDGRLSRSHCGLRPTRDGHRLVDLRSRNGTFVNGLRIEESALHPGDVIRTGDCVFVYAAPPAEPRRHHEGIVGESDSIHQLVTALQRLGPSDIVVLLEGETGTGKELAAEALHRFSGRRGPFVATNVSAMPDALFESELFGHVRGAFTGATAEGKGLATAAHVGTLFLDEIGDLSATLQVKLLRFLETKHVRPVGGTREVRVDVRVVSATNARLGEAVAQGRFRADLYARLAEATVRLPRLRARIEDLPLLARHFHGNGGEPAMPRWTADFTEALCLHDWPMNVRELRALVRRLDAMHPGASSWSLELLPREWAVRVEARRDATPPELAAPSRPLDEAELRNLLACFGGNVRRAAAAAGEERTRFYRRLRELGLRPSEFRPSRGPCEGGK